jgi:hypothetical protein
MFPQAICSILNTCHILISCNVVAKKVTYKVQLHFELVCMDEHIY